jgi:hypothetical protein
MRLRNPRAFLRREKMIAPHRVRTIVVTPDYIFAMTALANSLHFTSLAPSMRRAKS